MGTDTEETRRKSDSRRAELRLKWIESRISDILDAGWKRVLPWLVKHWLASIVLVVATVFVTAGESLFRWSRVIAGYAYGSETVLLMPSARTDMTDIINITTSNLAPRLPGIDVWTTGQLVTAMRGHVPLSGEKIAQDLMKQIDPNCGCWNGYMGVPHTITNSWGLMAFERLGQQPPQTAISFLIESQQDSGLWGVFPTKDPQYGSTYATAMAIISLQNQLNTNKLPSALAAKISDAVTRGRAWLENYNEPGYCSWLDYHDFGANHSFIGVTAIVVHALHRLKSPRTRYFAKLWLASIDTVPSGQDFDSSVIYVPYPAGKHTMDSTRYLKLPWMIIATVDSYRGGSLVDRYRALRWLDSVMSSIDKLKAQSLQLEFVAAEFVIALRYLANDPGVNDL
jgi:hypothetical protein